MQVQTSRSMRRLVGRLESGEGILASVKVLAAEQSVAAARWTATGVIEGATLVVFDPAARRWSPPRAIHGAAHVVSLLGEVTDGPAGPEVRAEAVLVRETDCGPDVVAGRLIDGAALSLEIVIECWDDLSVVRDPVGVAGLQTWTVRPREGTALETPRTARDEDRPTATPPEPVRPGVARREPAAVAPDAMRPTAEPPAPAPAPRNLSEAARALEAMPPRPPVREEPAGQPEPEPGDLLEHPSFGLVEVEAEAESGRTRIRLPSGSRREILLEVFEVIPRPAREGKRVYLLRPRRR